METLTRNDIIATIGPADEILVADLIKTKASRAELAQASAWLENEEALVNDGRRLPSGTVGELIEILRAHEEPDEEDGPAAA